MYVIVNFFAISEILLEALRRNIFIAVFAAEMTRDNSETQGVVQHQTTKFEQV
jgi:hypothetical protein